MARHEVKAVCELIREKIMSEIIVRRTRRDLIENPECKTDLDAQNILFPDVAPPRRIFYPLPAEIEMLYDRTMSTLAASGSGGFRYNRCRAIQFLKPEIKTNYANADLFTGRLAESAAIPGISKIFKFWLNMGADFVTLPGSSIHCTSARRWIKSPKTWKLAQAPPSLTDLGELGLAAIICQHWSIENLNHWKRDSSMWREDRSSLRCAKGAKNLALLRNAARAILPFEQHSSLNAAFDHYRDYRAKALKLIKSARPFPEWPG